MNESTISINPYVILLLLLGIVLVFASIRLRAAFDGKYEIKTIDLVLIIIPLLLFGVATGKIKDLEVFGVKTDFSDLTTVVNMQIENQVSKVPEALVTDVPQSDVSDMVETNGLAEKGSASEVPRLLKEKTQVLSFRLGQNRYLASTTKQYFDRLYDSSYLRFIVVNNGDGSLFGMYAATDIVPTLRFMDDGYSDFATWLNEGERIRLSDLPGFVPADHAVTVTTSKRDALKKMEQLDRASLPVVNENRQFVGTVDRAKLTASLILAVTETDRAND